VRLCNFFLQCLEKFRQTWYNSVYVYLQQKGGVRIKRIFEIRGSAAHFAAKYRLILISAALSFFLVFILYAGLEIRFSLRENLAEAAAPMTAADLHYYNHLTYKEQLLYNVMLDSVNLCLERTESLPYLYSDDEFARTINALADDHPQLFYWKTGETVLHRAYHHSYVTPAYVGSAAAVEVLKARLQLAVDIASASVPEGADEQTVQTVLHDYLLEHCTFAGADASSLSHTAFGALVEGKALASGYSAAYKLLLDARNIRAILVRGTAGDVPHVWNMVESNGTFGHVDVTWNDADLEFAPQLHFHGYYQLSDEEIAGDHQPDQPEILPDAAKSSNYYLQNDLVADTKITLEHILYREILTAGYAHREYVEFYLEAPEPFELSDVHQYEDIILDVIERINGIQDDFQLLEVYRPYRAAGISHGITLQLFYQNERK